MTTIANYRSKEIRDYLREHDSVDRFALVSRIYKTQCTVKSGVAKFDGIERHLGGGEDLSFQLMFVSIQKDLRLTFYDVYCQL